MSQTSINPLTSDEDVHICGSCRAEFHDVDDFVEHKKTKCPVKLAKRQKKASSKYNEMSSNLLKSQLMYVQNSLMTGALSDVSDMNTSAAISDMPQQSSYSKDDHHVAVQLSRDGTLGYFPIHHPLPGASLHDGLTAAQFHSAGLQIGSTAASMQGTSLTLGSSAGQLEGTSLHVGQTADQLQGNLPHTVEVPAYTQSEFLNQGDSSNDVQHEYVIIPNNSSTDAQSYSSNRTDLDASYSAHPSTETLYTLESSHDLPDSNPPPQSLVPAPSEDSDNAVSQNEEAEIPQNMHTKFLASVSMSDPPASTGKLGVSSSLAGPSPSSSAANAPGKVATLMRHLLTKVPEDSVVAERPKKKQKMSPKKKFTCKFCDYKTAYIKDLERHTRIHTGERPYKCDRCDKSFNRSDKLVLHLRYHMNDKPFKCDLCPYRAVEKATLRKHMKIHTQYEKRPLGCQVCTYRCYTPSQLQVHLRTHTGDTPFHCKQCDAVFKVRSDLNRHMKVHTGERPYTCEYEGCNYVCAIKCNLKSHYRTHHTGETLSCMDCDFKTSSKKSLNEHVKFHSINADLTCSTCNYQCSSRSALRNHMKTHLSEKPFQCSFCDYKSVQRGNIDTHMRRKHGSNVLNKSHKISPRKSKLVERSIEQKGSEVTVDSSPPRRDGIRAKCVKMYHCTECDASFVREESLKCHLKHHRESSSLSTAYAVLKLQQPVINTSKEQVSKVSHTECTAETDMDLSKPNTSAFKTNLSDSESSSPVLSITKSVSKTVQSVLTPRADQSLLGSSLATSLSQSQLSLDSSMLQPMLANPHQVNLGINDILVAAGMSSLSSPSNSPTSSKGLTGSPSAGSVHSNGSLNSSPIKDGSAAFTNAVLGQSSRDVPSLQVMQNISLPYIRLPNGQVLILTGQTSINQLPSNQSVSPAIPDGIQPSNLIAEIQSQLLVQQSDILADQIIQCPADSTTSTAETSDSSQVENLSSKQGAIPIQIILPSDSQMGVPLVSQLLNSLMNKNVSEAGSQSLATIQASSSQSVGAQPVQNFVLQIPSHAGSLKDGAGNVGESQSYVLQIPGTNFNS